MTFLRNTWTKTSPLLPSNPASRAARVSQRPLTIRAYPSQYKTCYLTSERIQNSTRTRWARDANPSGPCRVFGLTCALVVDIHDPALAATDEAQSVLCVGHPSRFSIIVPLSRNQGRHAISGLILPPGRRFPPAGEEPLGTRPRPERGNPTPPGPLRPLTAMTKAGAVLAGWHAEHGPGKTKIELQSEQIPAKFFGIEKFLAATVRSRVSRPGQ